MKIVEVVSEIRIILVYTYGVHTYVFTRIALLKVADDNVFLLYLMTIEIYTSQRKHKINSIKLYYLLGVYVCVCVFVQMALCV